MFLVFWWFSMDFPTKCTQNRWKFVILYNFVQFWRLFLLLPFSGKAGPDWHVNAWFIHDTGGFPRSVPGYPRVSLPPGTIVPRCAAQIRGPYSPKIARSKMGYPPKGMWSTCVLRPGRAPFLDIARPPAHRLTPNLFHPLRKSLLHIANKNFWCPHFSNFPKLWKKVP